LEVAMIETDRSLPAQLGFTDAAGSAVSVPELRGGARAVVLFFMRTATCLVCLRHVRSLAGLGLGERGVAGVVVVPGSAADASRVRRAAGSGLSVVSSSGAEAHHAIGLTRTLLMQHSGTLLVDAEGTVRYRRSAALPTGGFDGPALQAAIAHL
jgi:peroxiredoxin